MYVSYPVKLLIAAVIAFALTELITFLYDKIKTKTPKPTKYEISIDKHINHEDLFENIYNLKKFKNLNMDLYVYDINKLLTIAKIKQHNIKYNKDIMNNIIAELNYLKRITIMQQSKEKTPIKINPSDKKWWH